MTETDITERLREYKAFLDSKILEMELIASGESLQGSISATNVRNAYASARDRLYELFNEINPISEEDTSE